MHFPTLLLHHYTSGHGLLGIFETSQLWATSIHQLNDAREFSYAVFLAKSALHRALPEASAEAVRLRDSIASHLDAASRLAVYVACFSAVEDSLSQWRGYCPPAFGYSIGFDGELLRSVVEPQGFRLDRCLYDRAQQEATTDAWARQAVARLLPGLGAAADVEAYVRGNCSLFLQEFAKFAPFLKDQAFRDEHEWRIAGLVPDNDPRLRVRAGRSMLIQYLPMNLGLNRTQPLVWNVRIGPTPHPELASTAVCHYFQKFLIKNGVSPSQTPYRDW